MPLASNTENIRYNGTGRAYAGAVAGSSFDQLGELEGLNFGITVSTEKMKSTQNASRATILEVESERDSALSFGLREMSENNLKMALLGSTINTDNQSASFADQVVPSFVDDLCIDLTHLNVFSTKLTGTITGTLAVGVRCPAVHPAPREILPIRQMVILSWSMYPEPLWSEKLSKRKQAIISCPRALKSWRMWW